ncbi:MAG: pyruvate ferredoxin oxidoreductase, partial [Finegoldia magna]|nr:pyruvate ferredoxin oxidoreductase [Finegoldia magna]
LQNTKRIGVLEKDISFGHFGTVYTNVKSVTDIDSKNFVGGLGGRNITRDNIKEIFQKLKQNGEELNFIGAKL